MIGFIYERIENIVGKGDKSTACRCQCSTAKCLKVSKNSNSINSPQKFLVACLCHKYCPLDSKCISGCTKPTVVVKGS